MWRQRSRLIAITTPLLLVVFLLIGVVHQKTRARSHISELAKDPKPAETKEGGPPHPRYKPVSNETAPPIVDNFPLAFDAFGSADLPPIPRWNRPRHVVENTPLFIGFTRNWRILQQAVVSYIAAGWPPEDIWVVDNTGTMKSNELERLSLQNPFFYNHTRLNTTFGVNVLRTSTLLTFAQLQNFYLSTAIQRAWPHYFWSHMDVVAWPDERAKPFRSLYHRAVEKLRETLAPGYGAWGTRFFAYDRLTLVNTAAYDDVGGWDTMIPFYGTDCDMHERLAMAGYSMKDAFVGHIHDVGTAFDDLNVLFRPNTPESLELCPEDAPAERRKYGLADCRYDKILWMLDDMQNRKNNHKGGRNFWQARQQGGEDEPYWRDPNGFQIAIEMTIDHGRRVMEEKWGHKGCNIRGSGLHAKDAWKVEHDWD